MAKSILEVKNLKVTFCTDDGNLCAVNDVNFSLEPGETLGIVGESGCGKSVTSLSIMQLLPKRSARIEQNSSICLNGTELIGKTNREMSEIRGNRISMIFQDSMTSLNPVMTIGRQMIETYMRHCKISKDEARSKAVALLKKVGIPSPEVRMKSFPHQLSGGMRQRVMIAMALACEPDVLIADEPTTALDVTVQAQILECMSELKRNMNTAIIFITHDMGVVAGMADTILVMYSGYAVEYSSKKELFEKPLHPYTEGLLMSIPRLDKPEEYLHVIKGVVPSLKEVPPYCVFADRCPYAKERCRQGKPDFYQVGDRKVRCFRYESGGGEESDK